MKCNEKVVCEGSSVCGNTDCKHFKCHEENPNCNLTCDRMKTNCNCKEEIINQKVEY